MGLGGAKPLYSRTASYFSSQIVFVTRSSEYNIYLIYIYICNCPIKWQFKNRVGRVLKHMCVPEMNEFVCLDH